MRTGTGMRAARCTLIRTRIRTNIEGDEFADMILKIGKHFMI
jgi:hypothetical protein